jgi:hypothetical protein
MTSISGENLKNYLHRGQILHPFSEHTEYAQRRDVIQTSWMLMCRSKQKNAHVSSLGSTIFTLLFAKNEVKRVAGAASGIRTQHLRFTKALLYRMS